VPKNKEKRQPFEGNFWVDIFNIFSTYDDEWLPFRKSLSSLLEKFTWLVTEKALDRKYSHCAGKFTDAMHVKDQMGKFIFDFSIFFHSKYNIT
jgi:hypothetical protein